MFSLEPGNGKRRIPFYVVSLVLLLSIRSAVVFAESPSASAPSRNAVPGSVVETDYDRGRRLLQEGDFTGAQDAFRKALRIEFDNDILKQEFETLKIVLKLREELDADINALRWNLVSERLLQFYRSNDIHTEHIDLSLKIFQRRGTTPYAVRVIEAYILAERFQEALDFINSLDEVDSNPILFIEKACIFLAAGKKERARKIARSVSAESLKAPEDLLRLARLQAATQLHATAVKTLVRCFEQTPPTILSKVKKEASELPEFQPLLASSEFTAAMSTRSRISVNDPACAKKWVGVTIDERPWYIRNLSRGEIKFDHWKIAE